MGLYDIHKLINRVLDAQIYMKSKAFFLSVGPPNVRDEKHCDGRVGDPIPHRRANTGGQQGAGHSVLLACVHPLHCKGGGNVWWLGLLQEFLF